MSSTSIGFNLNLSHNSEKTKCWVRRQSDRKGKNTNPEAISGWMDDEKAAHPYNGIGGSRKKEWCSDIWYNLDNLKTWCRVEEARPKVTHSVIPFIQNAQGRQVHGDRAQMSVPRGKREREWKWLANGLGVLLWSDENVLELDTRGRTILGMW